MRLKTPTNHPDCLSVPVDENGFVDWLVGASPSDRLVYYRGHLAHDRCEAPAVLTLGQRKRLKAVAKRVMAACDQGLVMPVQLKLGDGDYLYIAVRRHASLSMPRFAPYQSAPHQHAAAEAVQ